MQGAIMRRTPAASKRGACARTSSSVSHRDLMRSINVAYMQHRQIDHSNRVDYTIFTFAIRPSSGQYYLMHLARAPSCKRQGLRERHEGEPDPWDLAGPVLEAWGVRRGRRKPALFAFGCLHRARERATVNQKVLAGDVTGLCRAQEGAGRAELVRGAESLGGDRSHTLGLGLVE